jgi:hypothetical protein
VEKCKSLNRAMRIGTNHGSLSARILSYYGQWAAGQWVQLAAGRGSAVKAGVWCAAVLLLWLCTHALVFVSPPHPPTPRRRHPARHG